MNSRERRVIHLSLRNETDVRSESCGAGPGRHVVVYPAGMASLPEPPRDSNRRAAIRRTAPDGTPDRPRWTAAVDGDRRTRRPRRSRDSRARSRTVAAVATRRGSLLTFPIPCTTPSSPFPLRRDAAAWESCASPGPCARHRRARFSLPPNGVPGRPHLAELLRRAKAMPSTRWW